MKLIFAALSLLLCACAELPPLELGAFDIQVKLGKKISDRYEPLSELDKNASKYGAKHLENVRKLSALDPYEQAKFKPLVFKRPYLSANVQLSNLKVTGVNNFILEHLEIRMNHELKNTPPFRADLNLTVPLIGGDVDFDGRFDYGVFPLSLSGHLRVIMKSLHLSGAAQAAPKLLKDKSVFQVSSLVGNALVEDVQVLLDVNGLDGLSGNRRMVTDWLENIKDDMVLYIARVFVKETNKVLRQYSESIVMEYLIPSGAISVNEKPVQNAA